MEPTRQPLPKHLGYVSSTLKGAVAEMSDKERLVARECFEHWRNQCEDIGHESPERVAFTLHEIIDERIARMRETSKHGRDIKCQQGCAACCHLHIGIFPHEAQLLWMVAKDRGISVDAEKLARQASKDDEHWHELTPEDQRCVFLGEDRNCQVYEHRPGACRKYHVLSEPELCDMHKHPGGKVGIVFDVEAEIVHSAAMTVYSAGNLAAMMLRHTHKE